MKPTLEDKKRSLSKSSNYDEMTKNLFVNEQQEDLISSLETKTTAIAVLDRITVYRGFAFPNLESLTPDKE